MKNTNFESTSRRSLAILLILLTLSNFACGSTDNTEPDSTTDGSTSDGSSSATDSADTTAAIDELEVRDLNDRDINILLRSEWDYEFMIDEESGDTVSDAIYQRNTAVEDSYNCNLNFTDFAGNWANHENFTNIIHNSVLAGDGAYDFIAGYQAVLTINIQNGDLMNLYEVPHLELDAPWWTEAGIEELTFNGRCYQVGGDIAVRMLMVSLLSTSFAMSGLAASDANAGSSKTSDSPIAGRYEGVIKAPGQTLRYVVIVDYEDGEYFAYSEHPDEGGARLPIDKFSKKGSNVVFSTSKLGISFKGKVNRGATEISGTFSQNGLKIPLKLKKTEMKDEKGFELKGDGPMMSGKYSGDLRFPGQKLRFELYVEKNGDKYDIYTKSPDQGGGKMAVETFRQNGRDVMFAIPDIGVRFEGKADDSSDLVSGTFFQYSFKIPLKLKKD